MPRKIPKWRQPRTSKQNSALTAQLEMSKRSGTDIEFISRLKMDAGSAELYGVLSNIGLNKSQLSEIHGQPFPKSIEDVFSKPISMGNGVLVNEIIWAAYAILLHGQKVRDFVKQKEAFEIAILTHNNDQVTNILARIEKDFGWSAWYIQNTLAAAQYKEGVEEKRRLYGSYANQIEDSLLTVLTFFIAKRVEGTAVPGYLQSELANTFDDKGVAYKFLKTKLFDLYDPDIDSLAALLAIDSHFSIVDYYESLIATLQSIAANKELNDTVSAIISRPIQDLYKACGDRRLIPVLIALGVTEQRLFIGKENKARFIEAYSEGRYQEALDLGAKHLESNVDDMGALTMRVRSELKLNFEPRKYEGFIGEIATHLRNVLSLNSDTYSSALSLYTLHDRFYGHSWTTFLRAVVNAELASDKFQYPSTELRRLIALEPHPTPFSSLLQAQSSRSELLISFFKKRKQYASTIEVYNLATHGIVTTPSHISEERLHRYLGNYQLGSGAFASAIQNFSWLVANSSGADSLRASAAASVAYSRCGEYAKSIEELVTGYLQWPHAPTTLPLDEIVAKLDLPENWPNSIYVPLVFELYTSYVSDDRMTHLRYAFERFQTDFDISSPNVLKERAEEFGLKNVIFYLDQVWRPEVMRQTVLYAGTREIEEERIKVCQVLAEIDSPNTLRYLAEIRERVKTIEIAKATNLVEQSKVYVDIAAIKKALRTRLGDAYARYKTAAPNLEPHEDTVMETLAEILSKQSEIPIAQFASMMHIVNPQTSTELDLQFAAMFAEVTNEFLRGDHGLNAYLSTRVRHGKLSNALRKPAADEYLVTERKEGSSQYVPNDHWVQVLPSLGQHEHEELSEVLEQFAVTLDSIIAHVKDDLIQVRVIHELVSKDSNRLALFSYQTSNLERMYMQTSDAKVSSLDEFIDLCVETLWDKTDSNLIHVQQILRTETRQQLMAAFDDLVKSVGLLLFSDRLGELNNHINRARTNTQIQLTNVTSWFKRSEVYDRQDYSIEFPVLIATNMIRNSISGAADWEGVTLNISEVEGMMPGRTLDAMVDMFCVLFENAIGHSGLSLQNLSVAANLEFTDGRFTATLSNEILATTFDERDEQRLQRIRAELTKDEARNKAQREGRSGFHKLWSIINAPQYRDPLLSFGFTERGSFEVTVSFRTEVFDDENAYN
jgi:hypothetical protein